MMRCSVEEAERLGFPDGKICRFHEHNPDQQAVMESCKECIYVDEGI